MSKKHTNYILVSVTALSLILSIVIFVYADINMKHMLNITSKQGAQAIVSEGLENNLKIDVNYSYYKVYVFTRNTFAFLLIMGIITSILTFLLTKKNI